MPEVKEVWNAVLEVLRKEVSEVSYRTWFEPIKPISIDEEKIVIGVQFGVNKNMIVTKYSSLISNTLEIVAGKSYDIEVTSFEDEKSGQKTASSVTNESAVFNPRYTFDNFVVGQNNSLAHAASMAVSENPGEMYNPLFLYGGSGLGKTHLLHAVANNIKMMNPDMKVMYTTTERFMNDYVDAILSQHSNKKSVQMFKDKYRNVDMLLADDIQFVGGRDGFQEEFFHTFNFLYENGKQIVLTSDRLPAEIPKLEDRLRTRFQMGLLADVQPPDFEMRVAILKNKIQHEYLSVDSDIVDFVAENIRSNVRDLEGAVKRMLAYTSIERTNRITMELAERALKDIMLIRKKQITSHLIIEEVEKYFQLPKGSLVSQKRPQSVSYPRQIAMFIASDLAGMTSTQIGKDFGGRNHTTVLHAIKKIGNDIKSDLNIERTINEVIDNINKN